LAAKPRPSRKLFTGRYSVVSRTLLLEISSAGGAANHAPLTQPV
jgi:hypothetical protein